jgi:hypothetical protein
MLYLFGSSRSILNFCVMKERQYFGDRTRKSQNGKEIDSRCNRALRGVRLSFVPHFIYTDGKV